MPFALIDCNNFYASCEALFDPSLVGRAVVVLSSNDGNVVARSAAAKTLGIAMGQPAFELRPLMASGQVIVRSSNFALYADISRRVMETIAAAVPALEIYSVDEAFVDATGLQHQELTLRALAQRIRQWVGIPVSIGLGPTKTLAKVANRRAKQDPARRGYCSIETDQEIEAELRAMELTDIWGIAEATSRRLQAIGIGSPLALRSADPQLVQRHLGVIGRRLAEEIQGVSCQGLLGAELPRRTMGMSQSFGRPAQSTDELASAIAHFTERLAVKLRRHGLRTAHLQVYAHTSSFSAGPRHYHATHVALSVPTHDSATLIAAATAAIRSIAVDSVRYTAAGVLCLDLVAGEGVQASLFVEPEEQERQQRLGTLRDQLNGRWRGCITAAASLHAVRLAPKAQYRSRRWTTRWEELPEVL